MPLTIEPSKPRLYQDECFLNLWMKTPKVSFDSITDFPWYVDAGHFQPKLDDKRGYDYFILTEESRKFFGLCWLDWLFVYTTLPFRWSPSAYINRNTGLGPSHFIWSRGVPLSQYIDDCHVGQLGITQSISDSWSNLDLANAAVSIAFLVLVSCGYFIGLKVYLNPISNYHISQFFIRLEVCGSQIITNQFSCRFHQLPSATCWQGSLISIGSPSSKTFLHGNKFSYKQGSQKLQATENNQELER